MDFSYIVLRKNFFLSSAITSLQRFSVYAKNNGSNDVLSVCRTWNVVYTEIRLIKIVSSFTRTRWWKLKIIMQGILKLSWTKRRF